MIFKTFAIISTFFVLLFPDVVLYPPPCSYDCTNVLMARRPSCLGVCAACILSWCLCCMCASVCHKISQMFFSEKYQVFFFIRKGSMYRRLGGRIDSPHKFWRTCPTRPRRRDFFFDFFYIEFTCVHIL